MSLVVLYEDADLSNDRDLYLFQGNDSDRAFPDPPATPIEPADWNVIISSVNYGGSGAATLELHVSDGSDGAVFGDSSDDGPVKLNNSLIAGEGTAVTFDGVPGSVFHIPQGTVETFEPTGDKNLRVLVTYSPGGIENFFAEAGEPAQSYELPPPPDGPPDIERLIEIGKRYGMNIQLLG